MPPIVTLTSDFTAGSPYVAQMKARVLAVSPRTTLVDICHDVPPQDIRQGALVLESSALHFPPGTIHVAVVDPGVGTTRRLVACELAGHRFIGPDNGLFEGLLRRATPGKIVELAERKFWNTVVSPTFHGRDVMAPVAGHLAEGVPLEALGPALAWNTLVRLTWPEPRRLPELLEGKFLYADSFGNLVSNVRAEDLATVPDAGRVIEVAGRAIPFVQTYGEAPRGTLVALIGSHGRLEVAVVEGNAEQQLNLAPGTSLVVRFPGAPA